MSLNRGLTIVTVVLCLGCGYPLVKAQENSGNQATPRSITLEELHGAPGRIIAAGNNRKPVGKLRVISYKVEEVSLSWQLEAAGHDRDTKVIRLTVTGEDFPVGPYGLWIGDERIGSVRHGLTELSAVRIGDVKFENGAVISVSRGTGCVQDSFTELPEPLIVPPQYRMPEKLEFADRTTVKLTLVPSLDPVGGGTQDVLVEITSPIQYEIWRNAELIAQVGKEEFPADVHFIRTLRFRMTLEQFHNAKDGAWIRYKYQRCSPGGSPIVRLDKNLLGL